MAAIVILETILFALALMVQRTSSWSVSCSNPNSACYGQLQSCPAKCAQWCEVDCTTCNVQCACDKPGAVCQDPRFIGGDGVMFYFHGEKDKDFCIVSDPALHINAHFIGKRGSGMKRDFTWVQSLGILFSSHQLYIGAQTVASWDNNVDALSLSFDGQPVILPPRIGATHHISEAGVEITRVQGKNAVTIEVKGSMKLEAHVVPITKQESRVHKYEITSENCFAHLDINFQFFNLSSDVNGVLGQTYVPGYKTRVKVGVPMPILGGDQNYVASSLFETDCTVSKFGAASSGIIRPASPLSCKSSDSGRGFLCRR
ncbi:hypothetical protein R1sor_002973 [Riccia sorocarpa]|uniref:Root cap n=1 Tax=Riccia sorocarpa TaxID=122646 RepID=A0ABD3H1Z2_9MARC